MRKFQFFLFSAFLFLCSTAQADVFEWDKASARYGVPIPLLQALSYVESGWDPLAVNLNQNKSMDRGHMQINSTWRKHPSIGEEGWKAMYHANYNTMVGAWVLRQCIDRYPEKIWSAVSCYHTGQGLEDLKSEKRRNRAKRYVSKVYQAYKRISAHALSRK